LKMKSHHRKQGNREHVLYVQCAVCTVRTVYSTCKCAVMLQLFVTNFPSVSTKAHQSSFISHFRVKIRALGDREM